MADSRGLVASRFGANLRGLRERAGISQDALAERALLHRTEVGLLERGERMPRIDTLIVLGACLSVSPAELLAGIKWKRPKVSPTARFDGEAARARQEGFRASGRPGRPT